MAKRVFQWYNVYGVFPSGSGRQIGRTATRSEGEDIGKSFVKEQGRGARYAVKAEHKVYPERNPRKVAGKSTTLKNMASVTVTKLPNGVVKITGRKMRGKKR
jgi:hypothetical protein